MKLCKRVGKYFARRCSMHEARLTRHGDVLAVQQPSRKPAKHTNGYIVQCVPGHPLAMKNGVAYVHRVVLYDAIGPGPHRCHWCAAEVSWGDGLEADHLDADRENNDPKNLVPSCHACNTRRANRGRQAWNRARHVDEAIIATMRAEGSTFKEIAARFEVSASTIGNRVKGMTSP